MDAQTRQIMIISAVTETLRSVDVRAWLFGGWGLDARIGRITREHGDVEFWVERVDADRSKDALIEAGASALDTQPPTESCEFIWRDTQFSTAYFDRATDDSFSQPDGRWADWRFPSGSFTDDPLIFQGHPILVMSAAGMLAMKEQYPQLRRGKPWRPKDLPDMEALRTLVAAEHPSAP